MIFLYVLFTHVTIYHCITLAMNTEHTSDPLFASENRLSIDYVNVKDPGENPLHPSSESDL